MARMIKQDEHAEKRRDILDAAQRMVYAKGYERMTIQDILADLQISNGAFYHYFDSKQAVLEALVESMQQEAEQPLLPIVQDPHMPALEKLQRFFATLDNSRASQKAFLTELMPVWFADDNAIVRQKVDEAIIKRRAPLLTGIIRQGIEEGVFKTAYPDELGSVILTLALGMGNAIARLLLASGQERSVADLIATYAVYTDAIERVLGADCFLYRPDAAVMGEWLMSDNK